MRKVVLQEFVTIDGFAAGPKGEVDFFASPKYNKGSDKDFLHFLDTIDAILLRSVTYRMFASFWPTATTDAEIIADKVNTIPKIVFSQSLERAPWGEEGKWDEATVVKGSAVDAVRKQKKLTGKDLVVWGSISLAQSLIREDLIDEYHLRVCPAVLGTGRALFPDTASTLNLRHLESKTYESGMLLLRYQPEQG